MTSSSREYGIAFHAKPGQTPTGDKKMQRGKIAAIAIVKNEQDVIEPFIRHNIRFVDHLIIMDNGSVDNTMPIMKKLAGEFPNMLTVSDDSFGHTQAERMTRLMNRSQEIFPADFVVLLDADEFIDCSDADSFAVALARIPPGGFGAIVWSTFVLTPIMLNSEKYEKDPLRTMIWRRRVEWEPNYKAIIRLDCKPAEGVLIGQGNHNVYAADNSELLNYVHLPNVKLHHYPVRSREQLTAKAVIGWMAYLAKDPLAASHPLNHGFHRRDIFERIANGKPIDDSLLCEISILYSQNPRVVNWDEDVVKCSPLEFERRYSTGRALDAMQLIARSWQQSIVGNAIKVAENLVAAGRTREATEYLKKAIAQEETADLCNALAALQYKIGDVKEAEQGFLHALELDKTNRHAAVNLGFLLFTQGRIKEGTPLFQQHLRTITEEEKRAMHQLKKQWRAQTASVPD